MGLAASQGARQMNEIKPVGSATNSEAEGPTGARVTPLSTPRGNTWLTPHPVAVASLLYLASRLWTWSRGMVGSSA